MVLCRLHCPGTKLAAMSFNRPRLKFSLKPTRYRAVNTRDDGIIEDASLVVLTSMDLADTVFGIQEGLC